MDTLTGHPDPLGGKNLARKPSDLDQFVSARIRQARVMSGMTQKTLAEAVGASYQQVQKYETGTNRLPAGLLPRYIAALAVDASWFYPESRRGLAVADVSDEDFILLGRLRNMPNDVRDAFDVIVSALEKVVPESALTASNSE